MEYKGDGWQEWDLGRTALRRLRWKKNNKRKDLQYLAKVPSFQASKPLWYIFNMHFPSFYVFLFLVSCHFHDASPSTLREKIRRARCNEYVVAADTVLDQARNTYAHHSSITVNSQKATVVAQLTTPDLPMVYLLAIRTSNNPPGNKEFYPGDLWKRLRREVVPYSPYGGYVSIDGVKMWFDFGTWYCFNIYLLLDLTR